MKLIQKIQTLQFKLLPAFKSLSPLSLVGLRDALPPKIAILTIKMALKRSVKIHKEIRKTYFFKCILWETATHQFQVCLFVENK